MGWIEKIRPYLEIIYFLSGIAVPLTIYVGLKDMKSRNKRAAVEKSLDFLIFFAKEFIPAIREYKEKVKKELPKETDTSQFFNKDFYFPIENLDKNLMAELIIKARFGLTDLLNQLEFFSAAVLYRALDEDIVYTPLSKVFCDFVESEHLLLSVSRSMGAPFKNLVKLYKKWSDRREVEKYQLQIEEAKHKIKEKGTNYKSAPPIGM